MKTENQEDKKQRLLFKTMINFVDEGIVISAADLHSMEKEQKFVERPTPHFEYGIIINKGVQQSQFAKRTDVELWYVKEEVRDRHYDKMLETLTQEGINVINIT